MSQSLQQKNTRYLLTRLPVVLIAGSLLFFLIMRLHARHMEKEQLGLKQQNVWNAFISSGGVIPPSITGEYTLSRTASINAAPLSGQPRDTSIYYPGDKKWVGFSLLSRRYSLNGANWLLTVYTSSKEIDHLIIKVFATEAAVFMLLLGAIVVINRQNSERLWKPFYHTLEKSGAYDIARDRVLDLPEKTGTLEFDQLNKVLGQMISQVNQAYHSQKQFTENASHELQTPLAIIRSKLDLLINEPGLNEETAGLLADITSANERMSQLNRNLLLLTKIGNRQFPERSTLDLPAIIDRLFSYYRDISTGEQVFIEPEIHLSSTSPVFIRANPTLAEILFSNLVHNSVVHNIPGGYIRIETGPGRFSIENSGPALGTGTKQLFERFSKGQDGTKTTGLGLALVKQICLLYDFGLHYEHQGHIHRVSVDFS